MKLRRIAILGATGHIAKGLIAGFLEAGGAELFLFARSPEQVQLFLAGYPPGTNLPVTIKPFSDFCSTPYTAVINCVGIGNPARLAEGMASIFRITETFDNLVLDYVNEHPDTLYINFSSGAAYGTEFSSPAAMTGKAVFTINSLDASEYYGIAKIHSEAKHRAMKDRNIVDLRVFGYFSRFIDLEEKFLLSEIVTCLRANREFVTGTANIVRDFVTPHDLLRLITACLSHGVINDVFDVYSLKPATKFEIIDYFARQYGLKYRVDDTCSPFSVTGLKDCYYSTNDKATSIGYVPEFSSLAGIEHEVSSLLSS